MLYTVLLFIRAPFLCILVFVCTMYVFYLLVVHGLFVLTVPLRVDHPTNRHAWVSRVSKGE